MKSCDSQFAVKNFLIDYGFEFKESGKNVSKRDVNIKCPFCDDPSYHLGVNKQSGIFRCWRCGKSGSFIYLVKTLLNLRWDKARETASRYLVNGIIERDFKEEEKQEKTLTIPQTFRPLLKKPKDKILLQFWKYAVSYCRKRNVPLTLLTDWYYSRNGYLLIPIYLNGQLVNYVCRAYLPNKQRYINLDKEKTLVDIGKLLYNIDNINNSKVIICEGIFDAIAVGLGRAVAMFHKIITFGQILLLQKKGIKKVYLCLDGDVSNKDIRQNVYKLNLSDIDCEVIRIPKGYDPASLPQEELKERLKCVA